MANSDEPPTATPSPQTGDERARARTAPADLLAQIVDHLPIALTGQDHHGRFILVNAAAAANLDIPENALIGASPADFLDQAEAAERRQWEINLVRSGQSSTVEEKVMGPAGEQTLLTWHQPVRLCD